LAVVAMTGCDSDRGSTTSTPTNTAMLPPYIQQERAEDAAVRRHNAALNHISTPEEWLWLLKTGSESDQITALERLLSPSRFNSVWAFPVLGRARAAGTQDVKSLAEFSEPYVREAMLHKSSLVRIQAAEALASLCGKPDDALVILRSELKSEDTTVVGAALRALRNLGEISVGATREILDLLKTNHRNDHQVRLLISATLASIGPSAGPILADELNQSSQKGRARDLYLLSTLSNWQFAPEQVVPWLIDEANTEPYNLGFVVSCLEKYGADAKSAVPVLIASGRGLKGTTEWESQARIAICNALGRIAGDDVEAERFLLEIAREDQDAAAINVRVNALRALGRKMTLGSAAIDVLHAGLNAQDPLCQIAAAASLADCNVHRDQAIALLLSHYQSANRVARQAALDAISSLAKKPVEVVAVFQRDLDQRPTLSQSPSSGERQQIVAVLAEIGPAAVSAVHAIAYWANHDVDYQGREASRKALLKLGKYAVPELILQLEATDRQRLALDVLKEMGPEAADAAPAILKLIADPAIGSQATAALLNIGTATMAPACAKLEADRSNEQVARLLGQLPPADADAGRLIDLYERPEEHLWRNAAAGLRKLGPKLAPHIERLMADLGAESRDALRQKETLHIVGSIGQPGWERLGELAKDASQPTELRCLALGILADVPESEWLIKLLSEQIRDSDPKVFAATLQALGSKSTAIGIVLKTLNDTDATRRGEACIALSKLGPAAKEAIPRLKQIVATGVGDEKALAAGALCRIEPNVAPDIIAILVENCVPQLNAQGVAFPNRANWFAREQLLEMESANEVILTQLKVWLGMPGQTQSFSKWESLRTFALRLAARIGPAADDLVPNLITVAQDRTPNVNPIDRDLAFVALGTIGPSAKSAVPICVDILVGRTPPIDREQLIGAANAIGSIGQLDAISYSQLATLIQVRELQASGGMGQTKPTDEQEVRRAIAAALLKCLAKSAGNAAEK
jgi:hypothetical protein